MREERLRLVGGMVAGFSLLYLYGLFMNSLLSTRLYLAQTQVEAAVFGSLLLRILIILSIPGLRTGPPEAIFIVISLENLLLPPLALLYILTNNLAYIHLIREIFFSWPAAAAILLPPYSIWRFSRSIYSNSPLSSILTSASIQWGSIFFIAELTQIGTAASPGLNGLTRLMLASLRREGTVGVSILASSLGVEASAIALYLATFISAIASFSGSQNREPHLIFLFPLVGTSLALGIMTAAIAQAIDLFFSLTLPTLLIATVVWWLTRAR